MKALILHGTGSNPREHWFPWLKKKLEEMDHEVWVPALPNAKFPSIKRYNRFLFSSGWEFNDNLLIGHSSGAVSVAGLLQALPDGVVVDTAILAGAYRGDLGREDLKETDISFDYKKIKQKAKKIVVLHSDDDPTCPVEDAKWIAKQLDADLRILHGKKHLNRNDDGSDLREFPELLEIIKRKVPAENT